MPLEEEEEDIKFEKLLADKRHKELANGLKAITASLTQTNNKVIADAITKQGNQVEGFAKGISEIANAIKLLPAPKVEVSLTELTASIKKMSEDILKCQNEILDELKLLNIQKEWDFKVVRNYGNIEKVIATQVIHKPKYQA